jgi:hypothetical protein
VRVIVAGSRQISIAHCMPYLDAWMKVNGTPSMVISGCAAGPDSAGIAWAAKHSLPLQRFPADWDRHGKAAGPLRNIQMATFAARAPGGRLIAFWDLVSRGTQHMILTADNHGLDVDVY